MRFIKATSFGLLLLASYPAQAEFCIEQTDEVGVTNPSDFSWRTYREAMIRFPDRLGIICRNAFELHKSGEHDDALAFFTECTERGNAPSMINLAVIYDLGLGVGRRRKTIRPRNMSMVWRCCAAMVSRATKRRAANGSARRRSSATAMRSPSSRPGSSSGNPASPPFDQAA